MQEAHGSSETELQDATGAGSPEEAAWPPPDPATGEVRSPAIDALSEQVETLTRHTQDSVREIAGRLDHHVEAQETRSGSIELSLAKLSNAVEAIQLDIQQLLQASKSSQALPEVGTRQPAKATPTAPERRPEHIERLIEKIWDEDPPSADEGLGQR